MITTQDWADYCYMRELEANGQTDFRFVITQLDEPEIGCTHHVAMFDWLTGEQVEAFTTDNPYGAVEAAREAQEFTLEERFDMYAERGW